MIIKDNYIIDFNFEYFKNLDKEVEFIKAFANNNQRVLFPCLAIDLVNYPKEGQEFILNRTVIKSKEWIFDSPEDFLEELEDTIVYWYEVKNEKEFISFIEDDFWTYLCCIIDKDTVDISEYKFILKIIENYKFQGEEYRTLEIKEKNVGDFKNIILPMLKKKFSDCL